MPTRNVNLTDELDHFVLQKVESGRYENASEVVRAAFPDHANAAPKGHPLFWEQAAATDPAPNGFHRPADIDTEDA